MQAFDWYDLMAMIMNDRNASPRLTLYRPTCSFLLSSQRGSENDKLLSLLLSLRRFYRNLCYRHLTNRAVTST